LTAEKVADTYIVMNPWIAAFASALCFALMSLFVKMAITSGVKVLDLTFYRFAFGSIALGAYFLLRRRDFQVKSWKFSLLRAFTNIFAVSLFYYSFQYLDLGTANLLNLTYPIFISILAPLILREQTSAAKILAVLLSSIGVGILLIGKSDLTYQTGIWIGLACGLVSAITIMSLKQARKFDSPQVIVAILMTCGTAALAPFFSFEFPSHWPAVFWASFFALTGQLFITYSFRGLSAVQGSIASSARILMSYSLGILVLGDIFEWRFLISFALVMLAIYLAKKR